MGLVMVDDYSMAVHLTSVPTRHNLLDSIQRSTAITRDRLQRLHETAVGTSGIHSPPTS